MTLYVNIDLVICVITDHIDAHGHTLTLSHDWSLFLCFTGWGLDYLKMVMSHPVQFLISSAGLSCQ